MDRFQLSRVVGAVKAFLLSKRSREALVFAFFVVISAGFWLMLTLNETYDMEVEFPLALENVDPEAVVTSDLPEAVHVTLRDKGTTLMGYYTHWRKPVVKLDFAAHDKGEDFAHINVPHSELQKLLTPLIASSSRIVGIRPDTIDYFYTRGSMKRVPVVYRGKPQLDPMYYLVGIHCDPDSVTVWGEEHFLDSLTDVQTVVTNFNALRATAIRKVAIAPLRGAKCDPADVTLTVEVDIYTWKKIEVPIIGTNFPGGYALRTFPDKATVSLRIGAKDYDRYQADNLVLTATYEELMQSDDSLLHLKLRSVPEGVSQVKIEPESVQFLIEQTEDE